MSDLNVWLNNADANSYFDGLTATEAKTLKDYLHGKLSPKEAASDFVKNFDLGAKYNRSFQSHLESLIAIAYDVSDPRGQIKLVKLLVAIRNLRYGMKKGWRSKPEMDLKKGTGPHLVLAEFAESIADDQDSLWCEVLAPIRGGSQIRPESNIQWINLNAFLARLAAVNTCNIGLDRVGYMCDSFIKHDDVRENAVMFNVGVSAAAQYMIYSASKVFEFCEREGTLLRHLGWGKWKAGFMEAQTNPLIDASGKKHATLAVAAMNEAENGWNRRQGLRGMDLANNKSCSEGFQGKQGSKHGMKRTHDETFSGSSV